MKKSLLLLLLPIIGICSCSNNETIINQSSEKHIYDNYIYRAFKRRGDSCDLIFYDDTLEIANNGLLHNIKWINRNLVFSNNNDIYINDGVNVNKTYLCVFWYNNTENKTSANYEPFGYFEDVNTFYPLNTSMSGIPFIAVN